MSQTERVPGGPIEGVESPDGNLSRLAELARQAYERKDAKNCLDLTRAMLLIDPDNADAQWMRSSIQSDMQRDLENTRTFMRLLAHSKESTEKSSESSDVAMAPDLPVHSAGSEPGPVQSDPEVSTASVQMAAPVQSKRMLAAVCLVVASVPVVIGLGVAAVRLPMFGSSSRSELAPRPAPSASDRSSPNVNAVQPDLLLLSHSAGVETASLPVSGPPPGQVSAPVPVSASASVSNPGSNAVSAPATSSASGLTSAARPPASRPAAKVPDAPVADAASGVLAVSSPTSVDIYKDNVYLGSVPISLELPPGTHTLEYRHGNLRRNVTHVINSNETTKAMVTFEVNVQINSRPWAEVFIEGVERKDLGQTPLSGVRVPIGSVLSFENPQFPAKKYRVTGNETGIQIVFP